MKNTDIFTKRKPLGPRRGKIYVRVSHVGDREGDNFITVENQIIHCQRYADQNDIEIVGIEQDLNLSGKSFAKRKVARMIDEVRRGQYEVVIVWKWHRWGRNLRDSMIHMALLEEKEVGGTLIAATEPVDVTTPTGVFTRTQFLAMAQLQLDQIREGWKDAHAARLRKGLPHGGGARFGYTYDKTLPVDQKFQPHPVQFEALREAYRLFNTGKSHRQVAMFLNEHGIYGNRGVPWTPTTVIQTLDSGFAAGRIAYGEEFEMISHNWPHAITTEEWDKYLERRETQSELAPRTAGQSIALRGLVWCGECGQRHMRLTRKTYVKRSGEYTYAFWRCSGVQDLRCDNNTTTRDAYVMQAVHDWVERLAKGREALPEVVAREMSVKRAQADIVVIQKRINEVKALKKTGMNLVIKGVISEDDYKEQNAEYDTQIKDLQAALRKNEQETAVHAVPPVDAFGALLEGIERQIDPDALNDGLKRVIHRILVHRGNNDRIEIVPKWDAPVTIPDVI